MAKELKFLKGLYTKWTGLTKDADSFYIVEHRNESDAFVKYDLYLGDKFLCDGVSKADLATAVTNLVGGATGDYNTLGGLQTKVQALETAVGTGSTVADGSLIVDGSIITSNNYVPALENIVFNGAGATKTYTIKNGDTSVEETIVSVDASAVITSLLNIIQAERVRANNAEATLQHQLNEHENRLKWIELGY